MKHFSINTLAIMVLLAALLPACSKKGANPTPQSTGPVLAITSLSATSGPYNASVTITGTGFSTTIADDKVFFHGKEAIVTAATATQLTASVPLGAGTGNVTVSVGSGAPVSGPIFTYQLTWTVNTIAGTGIAGNVNGIGTTASFNYPLGIALDKSGNLYIADNANIEVRKITPDGAVSTIITTASLTAGGIYSNDYYHPYGVVVDNGGNIYVSEDTNCTIRKSDPAGNTSIFVGDERRGGYGNDGTGTAAALLDPGGMTIDDLGNIFVAEYTAYTIRKITPGAVVTTVAGLLLHQGSTDGTGSAARFNDPTSVAVDAAGNLFVADRGNHLIRKITPTGVVTTIAGNGSAGYANGQGSAASFNDLETIVIDKDGYLYVTDTNMIRRITPDGTVSVFAGQQSHGSADGPAATASFFNCRGLTMDSSGNFYVSDTSNHTIRKISLQ